MIFLIGKKFLTISLKKDIISKIYFYVFISILITFVIAGFTFIMTHGDMNLFTREVMGVNYLNTVDNLKVGRYDLDRSVVDHGETFLRDGKIYMYFGIFPALLRGLIEISFKRGDTDWSRISTLLAATITFLSYSFSYFIVTFKTNVSSFARYFYTLLFVLSIAFASSITHLLSSAYIYHESIMWGLAWSSFFTFIFIIILYSKEVSPTLVFLLSLSSGLALLSRPTFASTIIALAALILVIFLVTIDEQFFLGKKIKPVLEKCGWIKSKMSLSKSILVLVVSILPLLICIGFAMKVNYERWGNALTFCNYEYYEKFAHDTHRLNNFRKSGVFNWNRIPYLFSFYFVPCQTHFSSYFPYINISGFHTFFDKLRTVPFKEMNSIPFDGIEPSNPVTLHSIYISLCALIGLFSIFRVYTIFGSVIVLSLFIQALSMLCMIGANLRYSAEFMPFLTVCALASFSMLSKWDSKGGIIKFSMRLIAIMFFLVGLYTSSATMLQQKLFLWSVPHETKLKIQSFYNLNNYLFNRLSSLISDEPLEIFNSETIPPAPLRGQVWIKDNNRTVLWFNGDYWIIIRDDDNRYRQKKIYFKMKVHFKKKTADATEPLLTSGRLDAGDFIYVIYLPKNHIQIGHDHWGGGGIVSKPLLVNNKQLYLLEVDLGSQEYPIVSVKLNGEEIIHNVNRYQTREDEITIGRNEIGGTSCSHKFSGDILDIERTEFL